MRFVDPLSVAGRVESRESCIGDIVVRCVQGHDFSTPLSVRSQPTRARLSSPLRVPQNCRAACPIPTAGEARPGLRRCAEPER